MNFYIWIGGYKEGFCVINRPDVNGLRKLKKGVSLISDFPDDAACVMNPEFPKDIQLADYLYGAGIPVISLRLKEILEKEVLDNRVEYLPLRIINHKGRVASHDYFIVNPMDVCDCIDIDKSGVRWNQITSNLISGCNGLVLKNEAIPEGYKLFRLKYWGSKVLVRSGLVETLNAADLTGLDFRNTEGYTGIG